MKKCRESNRGFKRFIISCILPFKTLGSVRNLVLFIQQGCIILIESDIYNISNKCGFLNFDKNVSRVP